MAHPRFDAPNYTAEEKVRFLFFLGLQEQARQQTEQQRQAEQAEQKRQTQGAGKYGNGTI